MKSLTSRKRASRIQRSFVARFRVYEENSCFDNSSRWNIVTIKNLSSSGIVFNFNKKIPVDTKLEIKISLPFLVGSALCLGKVCRVDEDRRYLAGLKINPVYGIAAYFDIIDENVKEAIDNFAEKIDL